MTRDHSFGTYKAIAEFWTIVATYWVLEIARHELLEFLRPYL